MQTLTKVDKRIQSKGKRYQKTSKDYLTVKKFFEHDLSAIYLYAIHLATIYLQVSYNFSIIYQLFISNLSTIFSLFLPEIYLATI